MLDYALAKRHLPIPGHVRLIICNSMVKHEHAGGQYNVRREEVEEGTRILHARWPAIKALRDSNGATLAGPFDSRQDAQSEWTRLSREHSARATSRFSIAVEQIVLPD